MKTNFQFPHFHFLPVIFTGLFLLFLQSCEWPTAKIGGGIVPAESPPVDSILKKSAPGYSPKFYLEKFDSILDYVETGDYGSGFKTLVGYHNPQDTNFTHFLCECFKQWLYDPTLVIFLGHSKEGFWDMEGECSDGSGNFDFSFVCRDTNGIVKTIPVIKGINREEDVSINDVVCAAISKAVKKLPVNEISLDHIAVKIPKERPGDKNYKLNVVLQFSDSLSGMEGQWRVNHSVEGCWDFFDWEVKINRSKSGR